MTARTQKSHEGEGLSRKSKFALLLAAIFLLALPLFAAANSSAVQSLLNPVVTQIQAVFSSADDAFVPNESPAIVTGGISSLSSSGIRPEATTFSGGGWHSAAVKDDGTLWSWGENWFGQTGLDIGPGDQETPAQVGTATNWAQVSAGGWHSLAIRTDGTLWAWGATENGGTGLGPLVTGDQLTPAQVGSATNWTQVSAGNWHSHGIRADGTLWAWGINAVGQIGLGVAGEQLVPAQVGTDTNWAAVSAGPFHSLGIRSDGTLWSWGGNMFAATGLDTTTGNQTTPAQVGTATDWVQVSAGERYSLAVKSDGTLWAWGRNLNGATGLDTDTGSQNTPLQVGTDTNWTAVSAGVQHSLAVKSDGTLWAWGRNLNGATGLGTTTGNQLTPLQVGAATDWLVADAATNGSHSFGMRTDGELWGWGNNVNGQLGIGDSGPDNHRTMPIFIWGPPVVESITPQGSGVATNTAELVITFDRAMHTANPGTVTLNGVELNLATATWTENDTVLTISLAGPLDYGTRYEVTVERFRGEMGRLPVTEAVSTVFVTEPEYMDIAITKNLQMPVGTITPQTEFAFEITPHSFNNETDQADVLPVISVPNIAFAPSDVATVTGDVRTVTKVSDFLLGDTVAFPSPGLFTYRISERNDTFSNTTTETMTFDPTVYQVTFIVLPDSGGTGTFVSAILVQEVLAGDTLGSKLEDLDTALTFTNTFVRNVEIDPTDPLAVGGLRISKTTTGIMPDLSRAFDFDIRLTAPSLATTATPPIVYRAQIIDTLTNETIGSVIEFTDEVTRTVALTHNQTLVFLDTHVGARYTAVELAVSDYTPHVVVRTDGVIDTSIINPPERTPNVSLSTGEQTLGEAANTADFTNTDFFVPPTGLDIGMFGMALLLIAAVSLLVIVSATRRSKHEMELQVLSY